ncbi:MAG: serpin family protein [Breznakibacter sp.]
MKSTSPLILALTSLPLALSCQKDHRDTPNIYHPIELDTKTAQMVVSNNQFGFNSFKELANTKENLFISPLSISQALGMVYNGATGKTAIEISNVLGYQNPLPDDINQSSKTLREALLNADKSVDFSVANSIWYSLLFDIHPDFTRSNQTYYDSETNALDFSDTEASKNTINSWVNDQTKGKIPSIVEQIKPENVMFLINAVYFKGQWKYKFDKSNSSLRAFYNNRTEEKQVTAMTQEAGLGYYANNDFTTVEMPYGNSHFSMVVLLPNADKTTQDIVAQLTPENWNTWVSSMTQTNVKIYLPKFKMECDLNLNDCLVQLGMPSAFSGSAEFSNMGTPANLAIDEVKHKTFVEVGEEGTEAAAVTSIGIVTTSYPPTSPTPVIFDVDRPFVFIIREKDTNSVIFLGQVYSL